MGAREMMPPPPGFVLEESHNAKAPSPPPGFVLEQDVIDPTEGMSFLDTTLAGIGQRMTNLARGAGQRLGLVSQQEIDDARALDAPLERTAGGKVGNVIGTAAALAPAALVPGAQTLAGSALIGAVAGAMQPTSGDESALQNAVLGGGLGAVGKVAGDKIAGAISNRLANKTAEAATRQAQNAQKDAALLAARKAGYVLPPSQANAGTAGRMAEGFAGKITTAQSASAKNQGVTNDLAKKALGLRKDSALTDDVLKQIRKSAGQAYDDIKQVSGRFTADSAYKQKLSGIGGDYAEAVKEFPEIAKNDALETLVKSLDKPDMSPAAAMEIVKKLRADATSLFRAADDPAKLALARANREAANAVEELIERNLSSRGMGGLVTQFRKSRQLIAKAHDVEAALNETTGNVSAAVLAKMADKGKPLTDELATIAQFGNAFPKAAQLPEKMGSLPGVSPLDYVATGIMSGAGAMTVGGPMGALAGAVPLARPMVRSGILSKPMQGALAKPPTYGPPLATKAAARMLNDPRVRAAIAGGAGAQGGNLAEILANLEQQDSLK